MKYLFSFLCFTLSYFSICAQIGTYETFDFIYVENSRTKSVEGIDSEQIKKIEKIAKVAAKNKSKVIFFGSNGNQPKSTLKTENVVAELNDLLINDTPYPGNKLEEKNRIRDIIYDEDFRAQKVNFHFFVTHRFAKELESNFAPIVAMLANEFGLTLKPSNGVTVNIYVVDDKDNQLQVDKIKANIAYKSDKIEGVKIDYVVNLL